MKRIYVTRHAKSSWADLSLADYDRPLNNRGKRDAPIMAQWCKDNDYVPQLVITSHAKRAMKTAKIFHNVFQLDGANFIIESKLYHAPSEMYIEQLYGLNEDIESVMLFGHNPGITYLANEISKTYIENVATCGILILESDAQHWNLVSADNCRLIRYVAPKLI